MSMSMDEDERLRHLIEQLQDDLDIAKAELSQLRGRAEKVEIAFDDLGTKYEVISHQLATANAELKESKDRHDIVIGKYNQVIEDCEKAEAQLATLRKAGNNANTTITCILHSKEILPHLTRNECRSLTEFQAVLEQTPKEGE